MKQLNVIYKITNTKNSKCYIGKAKNFEKRIKQHRQEFLKRKTPLYSAIKNEGWDRFTVEIIHIADSYEDLNTLEVKFIKEYNSLYPNGYNLTEGGTGGDVVTHHPNKQQLYSSRKGRAAWNKGLKGVQSAWNKGMKGVVKPNQTTFKSGDQHRMYGKKQSVETIAKRLANTDYSKIQRHTVKVLQCSIDGAVLKEWNSIKEASVEYQFSKGLLRWYLDKPKTLKGYVWKRKN